MLVAGRTPEKITQVAETICATGGGAEAITTVDTTREADVIRLFEGAMSPTMAARRPTWSSSMPATTGASISRS